MQRIDFALRGDHIPLDALLKATGLAPSGGAAKAMIDAGRVEVDGRPESRRTCKIRAGQVVAVTGTRIRVLAPQPTGDADSQTTADGDAERAAIPGQPAPTPD